MENGYERDGFLTSYPPTSPPFSLSTKVDLRFGIFSCKTRLSRAERNGVILRGQGYSLLKKSSPRTIGLIESPPVDSGINLLLGIFSMRKRTTLAFASALITLGIPVTSDAADGAAIYEKACKMCHATGAAGAPKVGDKAEWKDRIAKGTPDLELSAINGFQGYGGNMPARGGFAKLTDDEVKAAVSYIVENSK